jgi:hypothetical protein
MSVESQQVYLMHVGGHVEIMSEQVLQEKRARTPEQRSEALKRLASLGLP